MMMVLLGGRGRGEVNGERERGRGVEVVEEINWKERLEKRKSEWRGMGMGMGRRNGGRGRERGRGGGEVNRGNRNGGGELEEERGNRGRGRVGNGSDLYELDSGRRWNGGRRVKADEVGSWRRGVEVVDERNWRGGEEEEKR